MELVQTLPARWYTDPAVFERERWPIFGSTWVHVAYEHQLRRTGDYVELTVSDTGEGIAAADLPGVFDQYDRVERVGGASRRRSRMARRVLSSV